jgi:hypothetical protein
MKFAATEPNSQSRQNREDGMAVIAVIAIMAIVLIYLAGNLSTLHQLGRDLRLIERRQIRRLESVHARILPAASPSAGVNEEPIWRAAATPANMPDNAVNARTRVKFSSGAGRREPRLFSPAAPDA